MGEGEVLGVVVGAAGAHLGGELVEVEADDGGGGELLGVGAAGVGGAAGGDVVDEGVEGRGALGRVGDLEGGAVHDHRAVVDGVVEGGTGQHDAVDMGDGQAHREPLVLARPRRGRDPVEPCT